MIPFTVDQFLNVFEQYNVAVWLAQVFLYTIGMFAISLVSHEKVTTEFSILFFLFSGSGWGSSITYGSSARLTKPP